MIIQGYWVADECVSELERDGREQCATYQWFSTWRREEFLRRPKVFNTRGKRERPLLSKHFTLPSLANDLTSTLMLLYGTLKVYNQRG